MTKTNRRAGGVSPPVSEQSPDSRMTGGLTPPARQRFGGTHGRVIIAITLMLAVQAIVMTLTAAQLTLTHDEYWHIPVGLLNWKTGRFDFEPSNPPLLRMWATWPLLFTSAESPRTEPTTDLNRFGDDFLAANNSNIDRYVVIARLPIILLTIAASVLLARWAWEWHGPWAACLVTYLWACDPTALAHGSLVTTDAGGATFWIATLFAAWRFAQRPTMQNGVVTGVLLGLAQAAKFTNVLLVPLIVGLWCVERWRNESVEPLARRDLLKRWGVLLLAAWLCLNTAYLFRGIGTPLKEFAFGSQSARAWQQRLGPLAALPVPLPRDYVTGIDRQKTAMESDHAVYLDGELNTKGFASYYLMALLYKWPHWSQVLLLWATIRCVWSRNSADWRRRAWLLTPAVLVLVVASSSGMQLGIRYILPAIPLLLLFASEVASDWSWPKTRQRMLATGLLLSVFPVLGRSHPQYLAYFNEFSGGIHEGRFHLLDSNLDWGQDLHELKRFLAEHPEVEPLSLAYFGTLPPESLGLRYENPPTKQPRPGWHAVSVNFVMGRPHWTRDGHGGIRAVYPGEDFSYFRFFEPKYRIGASIDLYHLSDADLRR